LTLPVFESYLGGKYAFGKAAFDVWAETLTTEEYFADKTDDELNDICWNLHTAPYCNLCSGHALHFFKEMAEKYPDLPLVDKLLPLYQQMQDYIDGIWKIHGDFFPPMEKFRQPEFRAEVAAVLTKMGELCNEILAVFEK